MEIFSGILIGIIGVISALLTTRLSNKTSSDQNYNSIMQKEKHLFMENSKEQMSEYNDSLDETILLFKDTQSNHGATSEERLENIEKLKSIRNKINFEFPSFSIDESNFLLHRNKSFEGIGVKNNKKKEENEKSPYYLFLRRVVIEKNKEQTANNDAVVDTVEEVVFTMMILLENIMSYNKSDTIKTDEKDIFIEINDSLIDSYKEILSKLQQSIFYINRLTNEEREGRQFKKLGNEKINHYILEIENQISDIYIEGVINVIYHNEEEDLSSEENEEIKDVQNINQEELIKYEDLFPSKDELANLTVATLVITTLDRIQQADLELINKWSSKPSNNRFLLNTTPKHKDGKDFINYHTYKDNNIFIEANYSKKDIERLLEKYIYDVLRMNGQLKDEAYRDNSTKETKRKYSEEQLEFLERHQLDKNDSIKNLVVATLKSLEGNHDIIPMDLTKNKTLISKTNSNPDNSKLPKTNEFITKDKNKYYFNTHMSAPAAVKALMKYEAFLKE